MGFLNANGITRLVTDLGNIFEYKITAGDGLSISASNVLSTDVQLGNNATSAMLYSNATNLIGTRVDNTTDDASYYLRANSNSLSFATNTPIGNGTITDNWRLTIPLTTVELGQTSAGLPRSMSFWRGFNNSTFGDYLGIGAQNDDATDGFRAYIGSDLLAWRDYPGSTAGSYLWRLYPDELSPYQNVTDATVTACYGYGYTSATSGQMYVDIELPRRIRTGKTVTVSALTAAVRGVSGALAANNTNIYSNISNIAVASSGRLRLTLTSLTTNFVANTPIHIYVNSITFSVSS